VIANSKYYTVFSTRVLLLHHIGNSRWGEGVLIGMGWDYL